jgi:hypothetical protein
MTEDEARALITRLVGTRYPIDLYPFEFGWVAQTRLPSRPLGEMPDGESIGLGSYVIDKYGVVTAHSSLPLPVIRDLYVEERRQGRIIGQRIWPPPVISPSPEAEERGPQATRLVIESVFEPEPPETTLATGQLLDGVVTAGMTLRDERTGATVRLADAQPIAPTRDRITRVTLIVDSTSPTRPTRGMVLVAIP